MFKNVSLQTHNIYIKKNIDTHMCVQIKKGKISTHTHTHVYRKKVYVSIRERVRGSRPHHRCSLGMQPPPPTCTRHFLWGLGPFWGLGFGSAFGVWVPDSAISSGFEGRGWKKHLTQKRWHALIYIALRCFSALYRGWNNLYQCTHLRAQGWLCFFGGRYRVFAFWGYLLLGIWVRDRRKLFVDLDAEPFRVSTWT